MVTFIQYLPKLYREEVSPPAAATSTGRSSAAALEGRSPIQRQPIAKGDAALKVLNSLVQDPELSLLANDQTEDFFRGIIKQGAGCETVKQLGSATNKYDFREILKSEARKEKVILSYQLRQLLLAKAATSFQDYKIGRIWA